MDLSSIESAGAEQLAREPGRRFLRGVPDIRSFFRTNQTPTYFISPTPFNLLGIESWVRNFHYIGYYDPFDGRHASLFVPQVREQRAWRSMEEINNYLLGHPEVDDFVRRRGDGKAVFVMFDEAAEALAAQLGLEIALPKADLRERLDSKIVTTRLGNEAGVPSVPNVLCRAANYAVLNALARSAGLGDDLVVQMPYGDSGRTTFFIKSAADWDRHAAKHALAAEELKVMRRIRNRALAVEAVITRHGTLVGPVMADLTGHPELTPYPGGWCGNDVFPTVLSGDQLRRVRTLTQNLGERLKREGYLGFFEIDYLLDLDADELYLGEINPRISGITSMTDVTAGAFAEMPLFLFHLLEYMDVDYEIDVAEINACWAQAENVDVWGQAVIKQTDDIVGLITKAPRSGIWKMDAFGRISFASDATDWSALYDETQAFFLRIAGPGEYLYRGAELGIFVSRCRLQTDDGTRLTEICRLWVEGFRQQFEFEPLHLGAAGDAAVPNRSITISPSVKSVGGES
jgi:biotin carboxylase